MSWQGDEHAGAARRARCVLRHAIQPLGRRDGRAASDERAAHGARQDGLCDAVRAAAQAGPARMPRSEGQGRRLGADELFPVFVFVVLHANPPRLASNIAYVQRFRSPMALKSEAGCYFTHLQAAVSFLESLASERSGGGDAAGEAGGNAAAKTAAATATAATEQMLVVQQRRLSSERPRPAVPVRTTRAHGGAPMMRPRILVSRARPSFSGARKPWSRLPRAGSGALRR